jgi:hypothetical protein
LERYGAQVVGEYSEREEYEWLRREFVTRLDALRQLREPVRGDDDGPDMPEAPRGEDDDGRRRW